MTHSLLNSKGLCFSMILRSITDCGTVARPFTGVSLNFIIAFQRLGKRWPGETGHTQEISLLVIDGALAPSQLLHIGKTVVTAGVAAAAVVNPGALNRRYSSS